MRACQSLHPRARGRGGVAAEPAVAVHVKGGPWRGKPGQTVSAIDRGANLASSLSPSGECMHQAFAQIITSTVSFAICVTRKQWTRGLATFRGCSTHRVQPRLPPLPLQQAGPALVARTWIVISSTLPSLRRFRCHHLLSPCRPALGSRAHVRIALLPVHHARPWLAWYQRC